MIYGVGVDFPFLRMEEAQSIAIAVLVRLLMFSYSLVNLVFPLLSSFLSQL